jgi:predicted  nucleic acid-binding Zn-ribbon protein
MGMYIRTLGVLCALLVSVAGRLDGAVSREVEAEYRQRFENRAMFLKMPVHGNRQVIHLRAGLVVPDRAALAQPLTFRVGEQVRITQLNFRDSAIEFRIASIDLTQQATVAFEFGESLSYTFHQRPAFESALDGAFTEGLTFRDIDSAKEQFVRDQFQRVVGQISDSTGTSSEFVIRAMLSENPEFSRVKADLDRIEGRVQALQAELDQEKAARRQAETQLQEARGSLAEAGRAGGALQLERDTLSRDLARAQQELAELRRQNAGFQEQVSAVASKLNVQLDSNTQLGRQVEGLSQNIDRMTREREQLSGRVTELDRGVAALTQERDRLTQDLAAAERRSNRLQGDLNALTSNRQSLEATYIRTKESLERLELANRLSETLTLRQLRPATGRDEGEVAEVLLLSQPVAELEIVPPARVGDGARLILKRLSPNTVQFSEEERRLYEALGQGLAVEAGWESRTGRLQAVLQSDSARREIAPREQAEWTWVFQGSPASEEMMTLKLRVFAEDLPVELGQYQYPVAPGRLLARLGGSFSLLSMAIGLVLGIAVAGMAISLRERRRQPEKRAAARKAYPYPSEKQL